MFAHEINKINKNRYISLEKKKKKEKRTSGEILKQVCRIRLANSVLAVKQHLLNSVRF